MGIPSLSENRLADEERNRMFAESEALTAEKTQRFLVDESGIMSRAFVKSHRKSSYVEGFLDGTQTISITPGLNTGPMAIGEGLSGMERGQSIKALVDEMVFFNVVLEEEDIQLVVKEGMKSILAVPSAGKLAITWGGIKGEH